MGRRVAQVLRDLTIPIVLALIGIWFNWKQNLREERRLAAEKERADRQQVRMLLLETVMKLAKRHYLPIVSEAKAVVIEAKKEKAMSVDKLFFHVLMLLKRIDELKMKEGAVFFQKRFGESTVSRAWTLLRAAVYGVLGEELVSAALTGVVKNDWEYVRFVEARRKLVHLRAKFEHWLELANANDASSPCHIYGCFQEYLGVIDIIQAIFRFEADRPLSEGWYEEVAKVDFKMEAPTIIPALSGDKVPTLGEEAAILKTNLEEHYGRTAELKAI